MAALANQVAAKAITGLTDREAKDRLGSDGYNELPSTKPRNIFAIAFGVMHEPMFLLLVAGGVIYLLLGDVQEALLLLGFVFVVIGITLYQEQKTERALEALRDLSSPRALVIRDGQRQRIPGREVVCGDAIVLAEGDRVPADATVDSCVNLSVDESLLTGESVPVSKIPWDDTLASDRPGGDDLPFVYSGTLVVQGQGIARVTATGVKTEIGKIGKALNTVETESTPLQKETGRLVRNLAMLGLGLCCAVVVGYGLTRGSWLDGFLAGIAMAMAVLPEEFPVVLTIFLALGAWRISQHRVLTRRIPAVETLGSATVLCVDKTGTLTLNRMTVKTLATQSGVYTLDERAGEALAESFHELVEYSILASQPQPFDPMEKAFHQLGRDCLAATEHVDHSWTLVAAYPLSRELLAMSHVWETRPGKHQIVAAKGAPEAIADLCHLDDVQRRWLSDETSALAAEGLRVLGVARARFGRTDLPASQHDFSFEFLGLVGLADPVRPTVPEALRECYDAGIRVAMITGDYPGTAQGIARQIGLVPRDEVITGAELDRMSDEELRRRVKTVNVFARVVPEQKLRLVNALKANGEVVAMTGDGVNDAPALKAAHIGVAMGGRGTDVAREAAALVLLDDDFLSIVKAVRLGRRIFDNLRKAMAYIFAIHVPIAGLSLIPILLGWPLILLPVHIVFLELIIDPACSIVFEVQREDRGVMKRPPRRSKEPLFGRGTVLLSLLQGAGVLAVTLGVFGIASYRGLGESESRALAFAALVIANLGLILANLSWSQPITMTLRSPNRALWWVAGAALGLLGLVLYVPFLRELFRFGTLDLADLAVCAAAGVLCIFWFEGIKLLYRGWSSRWPSSRSA